MKIWIAVQIDHYGAGDMSDCNCMARDFEGLEVFTDEDEAKRYAKEYEKSMYASSVEIVEKEIAVNSCGCV